MKGTLFIQTTCLYQISFVCFSSFCDIGAQTITTASPGPAAPPRTTSRLRHPSAVGSSLGPPKSKEKVVRLYDISAGFCFLRV